MSKEITRPYLMLPTYYCDFKIIDNKRVTTDVIFYCPECKKNHVVDFLSVINEENHYTKFLNSKYMLITDLNPFKYRSNDFIKEALKTNDSGLYLYENPHSTAYLVNAHKKRNRVPLIRYKVKDYDFLFDEMKLAYSEHSSIFIADELSSALKSYIYEKEYVSMYFNPFVRRKYSKEKMLNKELNFGCDKKYLKKDLIIVNAKHEGSERITRSVVHIDKSEDDRHNELFFLGYDKFYHEKGKLKISSSRDYCISVFDGKVAIKSVNMGVKSGQWSYAVWHSKYPILDSVKMNPEQKKRWKGFVSSLFKKANAKYKYTTTQKEYRDYCKVNKLKPLPFSGTNIGTREIQYITYLSKIINGQQFELKSYLSISNNLIDFRNSKGYTDRSLLALFDSDMGFEKALVNRYKIQGKKMKNKILSDLSLIYPYRFLYKVYNKNVDLINKYIDMLELSYDFISSNHFNLLVKYLRKVNIGNNYFDKEDMSYPFYERYFLNDILVNLYKVTRIEKELGLEEFSLLTDTSSKSFEGLHDEAYKVVELNSSKILFDYSEEDFSKFRDETDDYEIGLARSSGELKIIGNEMRICVGSYGDRVHRGSCDIIYVKDKSKDKYISCIELREKKRVVQFKLFANSRPESDNPIYIKMKNYFKERDIVMQSM